MFWMGTSSAGILPSPAVPIPLFRGLEGLRLSFIHADAQERFNQINTLADLKKLKAARRGAGPTTRSWNRGHSHHAGRYSNLFRLMNDGDKLGFFPVVWWKSSPNAASWRHNIPTWRSISTC